MKNYIILLLVFGICSSNAQHIDPPKSIQSPNATSLGQYGDVPVSFNTGRVNVSIPLCSVNELGIPLDISLSYNTSGVRVNDIPGWLGQNWSLNAGGVITRTIKGTHPDEYQPRDNPYGVLGGYFHNFHKLNVADWTSSFRMTEYVEQYGEEGTPNQYHDLQPDIFTFNFMGHSGKFFLSHTGEWKVSSESNIKVLLDETDLVMPLGKERIHVPYPFTGPKRRYPLVIGKITLIDDKGISYVFGGEQSNIEYSVENFFESKANFIVPNKGNLVANAWYLAKVIDHMGNVIYDFEYERGGRIGSFYKYTVKTEKVLDSDVDPTLTGNITGGCSSFGGGTRNFTGNVIYPSYLKKITTNSGEEINFDSQESYGRVPLATDNEIFHALEDWKSKVPDDEFWSTLHRDFYHLLFDTQGLTDYTGPIDEVNFKQKLMEQLKWRKLVGITTSTKTIVFGYNDDSSVSPELRQRLKLENVSIDDKTYSFHYDRFNELPFYFETSDDHWGYYDGSTYFVTFNDLLNYYDEREPDSDKVKIGSLTELTYPTGGKTQFVYGINQYMKYVDEYRNLKVGVGNGPGLRIEKIINHDTTGKTYTKEYRYTENPNGTLGGSTGILLLKNKYYWPNWQDWSVTDVLYVERSFSTNNLLPMANTLGAMLEYSKVHEVLEDGSYTTYEYTNYDDKGFKDELFVNTISLSHSVFNSYIDKSLMRGKLKKITQFDADNRIQKRTQYSYLSDFSKNVRGFDYESKTPCGREDGVLLGNTYLIYYFDFNRVREVSETFLEDKVHIQESSYKWDTSNQTYTLDCDNFLRETERTSYLNAGDLGEKKITETHYYSCDNPTILPYEQLALQRRFDQVNTVIKENDKELSEKSIEYAQFDVGSGNYFFPSRVISSTGHSVVEEDILFDRYDSQGKLLAYHQKNALYTYLIYGYSSKYVIAKIESPNQLDYSGILGTYNSTLPVDSDTKTEQELIQLQANLRNSFSEAMVTTYTYKDNVGVSSITDARGRTEYYKYDENERLLRVVDAEGNTLREFEYNLK